MYAKHPAQRRYVIRLAVLMSIYLVLLLIAVSTFRHAPPTGGLAYAIGIAPALPVIGVFWAVMRLLVEEQDEYLRLLLVRQTLVATGFMLTLATAWGFLESFELVPHIDAYFAAVIWFAGLGVGSLYNKLTLGDSGRIC